MVSPAVKNSTIRLRSSTGHPTTCPRCTVWSQVCDQDAVINGLSLDYNSGQVEGTVNRIKMIKRQMFGRAKFDLLRKRVLLAR